MLLVELFLFKTIKSFPFLFELMQQISKIFFKKQALENKEEKYINLFIICLYPITKILNNFTNCPPFKNFTKK